MGQKIGGWFDNNEIQKWLENNEEQAQAWEADLAAILAGDNLKEKNRTRNRNT